MTPVPSSQGGGNRDNNQGRVDEGIGITIRNRESRAAWWRHGGRKYAGVLTARLLALVAEWLNEQHKTCMTGVRFPPGAD